MIHGYRGALLEKRELLFDAAGLGKAGVGYWDADSGIWRVEAPEQQMTGSMTRPSSSVQCFSLHCALGLYREGRGFE